MRGRLSRRFGHAVRVAAVATLVVAIGYGVVVTVIDVVAVDRLVHNADVAVASVLDHVVAQPGAVDGGLSAHRDADDAPVFLWTVSPSGAVRTHDPGAPPLPTRNWATAEKTPLTVQMGSDAFRVQARAIDSGWLVAGISLAAAHHVRDALVTTELVVGPVLLVAVYLGALIIGVKASAPVELSRRRQLEFTADASHELRTPLSVIEAEVDLALRRQRDATSYRESLGRVKEESGRLRNIVDSLLWLARFDSEPPLPGDESVDLVLASRSCGDRFRPIAEGRQIALRVEVGSGAPVWVKAPREWVDRLLGVLVDNALRYAGSGGTVRVTVRTVAGRPSLLVEDTGPGIPPEERERLFDRFHRLGSEPGGAGLGLAIADSVVRTTGGRWRIGSSPLGGAQLEVQWPRGVRHPAGSAVGREGPGEDRVSGGARGTAAGTR